MAHFAKIENNVVSEVIVAEQDFIDTLEGTWVQTSYNTRGGVHLLGGTPFRKNFAGIGYTYDSDADAFIPPQPFPSFVLDTASYTWNPPIAHPNDGESYEWNEATQSWDLSN